MDSKLYIIEYESSRWCGGQSHVVVHASSEEEAEIKAEAHMAETMTELFADDDAYEFGEDCEDLDCPYTVNSIEVLDPSNEHWEFFQDPTQSELYPVIT